MTTILLVDDDPMITEPLQRILIKNNYQVLVKHNGREGLQMALQEKPDLVILDVLLPELDGWALCRALRTQSMVPILILTAQAEETDRILALELGADDYLTKPFSVRELLARIHALLRRIEWNRETINNSLTIGDVHLDFDARRAFKSGQELSLRCKEFEVLSLLMSKAGQVVTHDELFNLVWGKNWFGDTSTLMVHISGLRKKIEDTPGTPHYIQTVRNMGYRFISAKEPVITNH